MLIVQLIGLIQNVTLNAAQASCTLRIPEKTAQQYFARFHNEEAYLLSQPKKSGRLHYVLANEHPLLLQDIYDKNPSATLKQAQDQLWERFTVVTTQSDLQNIRWNAAIPL